MSNNTNITIGPGFVGCLTILFITLKLLDKLNWSWVWVLSPLWISVGLGIFIVLCVLLFIVIAAIVDTWLGK